MNEEETVSVKYIRRRPNVVVKRLSQLVMLPQERLREIGRPSDNSLDVLLSQLALGLRQHSVGLVCRSLEEVYEHHFISDTFLECASVVLVTLRRHWLLFFSDVPESELGFVVWKGNFFFLVVTKKKERKSLFEVYQGIHRIAEMKQCLVRNHLGVAQSSAVEVYANSDLLLANNPNLPLSIESDGVRLNVLNNFINLAFKGWSNRSSVQAPYAPSLVSVPDVSAYPKVNLLIPVYNNPGLLPPLFATLAQDAELVERVIVGDDCSSPETYRVLENLKIQYESIFSITIIRQSENVGFVRNVNNIYREVSAPIAVLLNTDILLPHGWLARMVRPFVERKKVGLATPLATNGANLTVLLPGGTNWREVDSMLQQNVPLYERACTAICYCLGIATKHFPTEENLFCEEYINGYGDDSDLHFRCLERKLESIIVDNLLIHHYGGETFDLLTAKSDFKIKNRQLFFKKWKKDYQREMERFSAVLPLSDLITENNKFSGEVSKQKLDVLFVLPGADTRYGGVNVVYKLASHLVTAGFNANIVTIVPGEHSNTNAAGPLNPYVSLAQVSRQVESVGLVVATGHDTVPSALSIAQYYGAHSGYFVQGPEIAFSCGVHAEQVIRGYDRFDTLFCGSSFLCDHIMDFTKKEPVCLDLGPSIYTFYDHNLERESRSVAISLNTTPEKGVGISISAAYKLKKRGFKIYIFGRDCAAFHLSKDFSCQEWLTDNELAVLFSKVSYYFDSSVYEGLGLLPIESAFCGAIPIISHNGGCDQILTDGQDCLKFKGIGDLERVVKLVDSLDREKEEKMRKNGRTLTENVNQEKAFNFFVKKIYEILRGTSA